MRATVAPRLPARPVARAARLARVHRPTLMRRVLRRHLLLRDVTFPPRRGRCAGARPPPTTRAAAARSSQGAAIASPCAAAPTQPPPCSWVRRLKTPPHRTSQGSNIHSPAPARESRYSLPSAASGMAERRALFARSAPCRTSPMQRRLPVSRPRRADACRASPARVAPRGGAARSPPSTARAAAPPRSAAGASTTRPPGAGGAAPARGRRPPNLLSLARLVW